MKIVDIRATTVTVPLRAPLRHANGCHWGRFVRTIVEVETDEGLVGLGEMGGGGASAEAVFRALKSYLVGHDPARLEELRFLIANPTASLYNNRTQVLAALEFACLDILGQRWGVPVSDLLGGRLRERVPFAAYLFFRYPNPKDGRASACDSTATNSRRTASFINVRAAIHTIKTRSGPVGRRPSPTHAGPIRRTRADRPTYSFDLRRARARR
jgi:L-alanine-DL-glutamate epimerase-like enolase superfamily enzyme